MQLQSVFFSKAMYGKTFNTPSNPTTDTYCPTGPTTVTMATAQLFFFPMPSRYLGLTTTSLALVTKNKRAVHDTNIKYERVPHILYIETRQQLVHKGYAGQ